MYYPLTVEIFLYLYRTNLSKSKSEWTFIYDIIGMALSEKATIRLGTILLWCHNAFGHYSILYIDTDNIKIRLLVIFKKNYINKYSQFSSNIWAETPINNARITNGPEAIYNYLNTQFYHPHSNIHHVVDVLMDIKTETALKINTVKKKKIDSISLKKSLYLN